MKIIIKAICNCLFQKHIKNGPIHSLQFCVCKSTPLLYQVQSTGAICEVQSYKTQVIYTAKCLMLLISNNLKPPIDMYDTT